MDVDVTRLNPITATVATTATQLLRPDPKRTGFTLINYSSQDVWAAPNPAPALNAGIKIPPNGGMLLTHMAFDGELPRLNWYAIAIGAAATVATFEHRRT